MELCKSFNIGSNPIGASFSFKIFISMNLKRIIKEEIDDFDWVKETNPIKPEDLADGYYFHYNGGPIIIKRK